MECSGNAVGKLPCIERALCVIFDVGGCSKIYFLMQIESVFCIESLVDQTNGFQMDNICAVFGNVMF